MTMLQVILNYDIEKEVIAFDETLNGTGYILVDDGGLKNYFVKLQDYKAELIKQYFINPPQAENLYINPNFVMAVGEELVEGYPCLTYGNPYGNLYGNHEDIQIQPVDGMTVKELLELVEQKKEDMLLAE